jgi:hypothetical protein
LCDFVYNVGATNFSKSTLLQDVNHRRFDDVPIEFRRYVLANGKELAALKTRREREVALFFEGQPIPKAVPAEAENVSPIDIVNGKCVGNRLKTWSAYILAGRSQKDRAKGAVIFTRDLMSTV